MRWKLRFTALVAVYLMAGVINLRNNVHIFLIYITERLTGAGAKETAIGRVGSYGRELAR